VWNLSSDKVLATHMKLTISQLLMYAVQLQIRQRHKFSWTISSFKKNFCGVQLSVVVFLLLFQGNLGTLYITNVRVAWQCKLNDNFNVSIPYLQMKVVKVRDTKFGVAMVLEAGNLVLGFKVDPYETLKKIVKEIQSLHQVYSSSPVFGVEYSTADEWEGPTPPITDTIQEDVELVGTKKDALAAYLADPHKKKDREPVYSHELGLAIEALPDGYSILDLWQIS
jgi:Bardet-Biedl syndrome 5 protein